MNKLFYAGVATACLTSSSTTGQDRAVWIETGRNDGMLSLDVFAALDAGESGTYQLIAKKSGSSGTAVTRQGGRIVSGTGEAIGPLMTSKISLRGDDILEAELVVTTSTGRMLSDSVIVTAKR